MLFDNSLVKIEFDRDSVCMSDDCFSHRKKETLPADMLLSQLLLLAAEYVPNMSDIVWAVDTNCGVCGYIYTDSDSNSSVELSLDDLTLAELKINRLSCRHYYQYNFNEKYAECATLLEKVKRHIADGKA